jgi:hypothetical protein
MTLETLDKFKLSKTQKIIFLPNTFINGFGE